MRDVRRELVRRKIVRHGESIGDMAFHPQRQRLEPLKKQKRVEWAHRSTEIAQRLGPQLHQVPVRAERLVEQQAVIRRRGIRHYWIATVGPVEGARVDDYAAD